MNINAFITGGTSGLGRALAVQLRDAGARVGTVSRRSSDLEGILHFRADLSRKEAIYPLAGEVHARLGDVDLLVHAASYLGATPLRLLIDSDCEDLELALQTNLLGPFRLTKALLPAMLLKGQGTVVNITSDASVNAYPTWGGYAISKAALDHMTKLFDGELKNQGVRFVAIDPGDMNTPMHFAAIPGADPATLRDPAHSAQEILRLLARGDFGGKRVSV